MGCVIREANGGALLPTVPNSLDPGPFLWGSHKELAGGVPDPS